MCAPRVTRHTSIRYSSCCHTRVSVCGFLVINVCNHEEHYDTPCTLLDYNEKKKKRNTNLCTFMTNSRSVLLRMMSHSDISCSNENQNTHFMFNNIFFRKIRAVCEIMWENMVQPDRPQ